MFFDRFSRSRAPRVPFFAGLSVLAACFLTPDAALAESAPKWLSSINFEARPGTSRSLGEADLFVPFAQNDETLLFGNARFRFDDADSREGNLGLGLRHMLASGWNLGVYGYYDRRRTGFDNYFNQATFGVEALGRDFDFRANAYLPFGDTAKSAGSISGATFASLVGSTIQVTTLGTTFREERALRGFDAEVGWRVPIWSADDSKALRLYAGMFHFDDSVVKAVTGPRLRAELTMYEVPHLWDGARLTLGVEFQHDDVRGSQGFGLVRLSVPLQPARHERKLNWQERRMVDRVVRDVDIVTEASTRQAPSVVETATQTTGGETITVIDSGTTTGAALPGAVTAAGPNSLVILSGTFSTTAATTLQTGQRLMGTGALTVQTASGRTATLTTPGATINFTNTPGPASYGLQMADGSTLTGMTIHASGTNTTVGAVLVDTKNGVTIADNTLSASTVTGLAQALALVTSTATVTGNHFSATATGGNYATSILTNLGTYTVAGNTFDASGGNVTRNLSLQNGGTFNAGSTGNTLTSGNCFASGVFTGSIGLNGGATCP